MTIVIIIIITIVIIIICPLTLRNSGLMSSWEYSYLLR